MRFDRRKDELEWRPVLLAAGGDLKTLITTNFHVIAPMNGRVIGDV